MTVLSVAELLAAIGLAILGLPPVDWHGPLHRLGIMDPLCGATRGVRLTLRGDLAGALRYNPPPRCWSPPRGWSCCAPPGGGSQAAG